MNVLMLFLALPIALLFGVLGRKAAAVAWAVLIVTPIGYGYLFEPKWWFALQYNVASDQVTIQQKPHDCEYETAPLGNKNCHYEKQISRVIVRMAPGGRQILSYDDGKTWYEASGSALPSVTVSWSRIDD